MALRVAISASGVVASMATRGETAALLWCTSTAALPPTLVLVTMLTQSCWVPSRRRNRTPNALSCKPTALSLTSLEPVAAVKTFCISCSTNKPEPVCTSGDLSVTFTSSDNSDNEQNEDSDDEQDESSDDEQDEGSNDEQDDGSDDEQDEDSADVNPSEDDNSDGSADDHDQQDKEHETDKDSDVDKESDHDMERENDEDNDLDAESNLVFVWHSASNTWVKQNIDDGSFDDFEYDIISILCTTSDFVTHTKTFYKLQVSL